MEFGPEIHGPHQKNLLTICQGEVRNLNSPAIGQDKPLLSYVKPHSPISSFSVARWIVTLLKLTGIDTDTFKSHSVRSASATAAASAGITTNQIMDAADWRSESVFERFYYKLVNSNPVEQAVLLNRFSTNIPLICDPSIPKCNYLNGSDHRVIASYMRIVR